MRDGVGPGSYADRADIADTTVDGDRASCRCAPRPASSVARQRPRSARPAGRRRRRRGRRHGDATSGSTAPRCCSATSRSRSPAAGRARRSVLLPINFARIGDRRVKVRSILGSAVRRRAAARASPTGHPARGGQDHGATTAAARSTPRRSARSRCCERRHRSGAGARVRGRARPARAAAGGRALLWQGAPDWRVLARDALHVRSWSIYFGVLLLWRGATVACGDGGSRGRCRPRDALAAAAGRARRSAILVVLAWLVSRTSVYTITDRRVVMRDRHRADHHLQPAVLADRIGRRCSADADGTRRHRAAARPAPTASPTCTCGRMRGRGSCAHRADAARARRVRRSRSCWRTRWPTSAGMRPGRAAGALPTAPASRACPRRRAGAGPALAACAMTPLAA